ncbi:MAG TPA: tetratricopeptide repeat protein [Candidatus Acidoferrales bacterium]|nr:tetratricopeptide repeat protein [Candidatus Acidoferrales bacterium]
MRASLMVMVRDPSGGPIDLALVTLEMAGGGMIGQARADVGRAEFSGLVPGDYTVQVTSNGYVTERQSVNLDAAGVILSITLRALPDGRASGASGPPAMPVLAPKAQKLAAKALQALRAGKPADARQPLEEAYRLAPGHPYVNFLYGVYSSRTNDWPGAELYWQRAISIFPKYVDPLLQLGDAMLRQNRPAEAVPYLNRAIEVEPTGWRPHAMMAQALSSQHQYDEAIKEADRALELGQSRAAGVEPILARALVAQGNKERAITVLQQYLRDRPDDSAAQRMLDSLRAP